MTRAHLTQLMALMSEGSARYAWYLDVLLELTRGLDRSNVRVPLRILHLLLARPGYLLVLFLGKAGRLTRPTLALTLAVTLAVTLPLTLALAPAQAPALTPALP